MLHLLRGFFTHTDTEDAVLCYYHSRESAHAALERCRAIGTPIHESKNKPGKWFIRCRK